MNKRILPSIATLLLVTQTAFPAGLRIASMDTFAASRGNAFVATADNPSAVFYNPGGLTQLDGHEISAGVYTVQFSSEHTAPNGETTELRDKLKPVPNFYYGQNLRNTPYAFGIGAYLPFGLVTEWPEDAPFRELATRSELTYLRISTVVAYKVNPQLSIGGGPTFNYSEIKLRRGIPGVPGEEYRIEGDDTALGYNIGVRWQPQRQHAFGLSYHSPTRIRYKGSDEIGILGYEGDASIDTLTFPEIVIAGYSYRPNPKWNLEANIDWTKWSRFDSTTVRSGLPDNELDLKWDSIFMYGAGATRYFSNAYFVSAGYLYADNAIPDETFNPFLPDSRLHFFNIGVGSKGKPFSWQAGYQYVLGDSRTVPGTALDGSDAGGRYENEIHALSFTVAFKF